MIWREKCHHIPAYTSLGILNKVDNLTINLGRTLCTTPRILGQNRRHAEYLKTLKMLEFQSSKSSSKNVSFSHLRSIQTDHKKTSFYPEITKNLMLEKCEFCENWDFKNVNFEKNKISKMWILLKMRLKNVNSSMWIFGQNMAFCPSVLLNFSDVEECQYMYHRMLSISTINQQHLWVHDSQPK